MIRIAPTILFLLIAALSSADVEIALRPNMPALSALNVPALWAGIPDADRIEPKLKMSPPHPFTWVYEPGSSVEVTVTSEVPYGHAVLTVWDWNNVPVAQHEFVSPFNEMVRFSVEGRGTYLLTLDMMKGAEDTARLARSFSVCPSNRKEQATWRATEFHPGCCSFPGRQNWSNDYGTAHPKELTEAASRELEAELSARLGLVLVRPDLPVLWPSPDKKMDFTLTDDCMKCWTDRGFKLVLQIGFPGASDWAVLPKYADVKDPKWRYPHTEQVVRTLAAESAARYGKLSDYIEVQNEPDNPDFWRGTIDEFVATHKWISEEVRKNAPHVPILSGGFCLIDPERTGIYARELRTMVDGVGYHSHGEVGLLEGALTAMRAVHAAAGYDKPRFVNTEMGYANWRLDVERTSAAVSVQKLVYCWSHGNPAALLYASRETGGPRSSGDWGFLDYTFCPRFTYGSVASFCELFAGAKRDAVLRELNGLYAYRFKKGDSLLIPFYVSQGANRDVVFETDANTAVVVDAMGNREPVSAASGKIAVSAGIYPQTLVIDGNAKIEMK